MTKLFIFVLTEAIVSSGKADKSHEREIKFFAKVGNASEGYKINSCFLNGYIAFSVLSKSSNLSPIIINNEYPVTQKGTFTEY